MKLRDGLTIDQLHAEFLTWLRQQSTSGFDLESVAADGDVQRVEVTYSEVAGIVEGLKPRELMGIVSEDAPGASGEFDYDTWTEARRRRANVEGLRVLVRVEKDGTGDDGIAYLTPDERAALQAFSGWGGVKLDKLPLDPEIWPPAYMEALEDYHEARRDGRPLRTDLWRGVRQQFFTPVHVADYMVKLALEAVRRPVEVVLEPSSGVGRFLGVYAGSFGEPAVLDPAVDVVSVELDPLLQRFQAALYFDAVRAEGAFESFARRMEATGATVDMIVSNPPYPKRTRLYSQEHGPDWSRAAAYFTWASMRMLAPGGVLCTLVPIGQMTSNDLEARALRRMLLQEGHCVAAVPVPVDVFPGALVQTIVHCWVRRPEPLTGEGLAHLLATDPRAQSILEGTFISRALGVEDVFGTWQKSQRWPGDLELRGARSGLSVEATPMVPALWVTRSAHPDHAGRMDSIRKVAGAVGEARLGEASTRKVVAEVGSELEAAIALETRLAAFVRKRESAPPQAELARPELLADVLAYITRWGNPHTSAMLAGNRRQIPVLLAIVTPSGAPTDALVEMQAETVEVGTEALNGASVETIVGFYCDRIGDCPEHKLSEHLGDKAPPLRDLPESICIYFSLDGSTRLYTQSAYVQGHLYPRLDNVKAALLSNPEPWLKERLSRQQEWLNEHLGEKSIFEIQPAPNAGYLVIPGDDPYAILNEYVAYSLKQLAPSHKIKVKLYQENRRYKIQRTGDWHWGTALTPRENISKLPAQWWWTMQFVGYLNNDLDIDDVDQGETKETATVRYDSTDFNARKQQDQALEDEFRAWIATQEKWHKVIETAYNRTYRGYSVETVSDAPLAIARWHRGITPQPHQNEAARWFARRGAGILAHDVGLGKSFAGILTLANERQAGRVRRPMVLVPNNLVVNWYRELKRALPDYRVCVIGYEPAGNNLKPVTREERAVQWQRVALGDFEATVVAYSTFHRDSMVSKANTRRMVEKLVWIQAGMGEDSEAVRKKTRAIQNLEADLPELIRKKDRYNDTIARNPTHGNLKNWQAALEEVEGKIAKITKKVEGLKAEIEKLGGPISDGDLARVSDKVEDMLSGNRFRPTGPMEIPWRDGDPKAVLAAHLRNLLLAAGGGNLESGTLKLLKGTEWESDSKKDPAAWLKGLRKLDVVQILGVLDPIDYIESRRQVPVPALVEWESLGVDLLIVDEAHNFKNLFAPERNPYGADSVKYMGAGSGDTQRSWDLWLKTQMILERRVDQGVLLLTATPQKNSPLEVFNLIQYVSSTCWANRGINTPEEFVARYCILEDTEVPDEDGTDVIESPAVVGFQNQFELWVARDQYTLIRDISHAPSLAVRVPGETVERIEFEMHPSQSILYEMVQRTIDSIAEEMQDDEEGDPALGLRLRDLQTKIALDPRLIVGLYYQTEKDRRVEGERQAAWAAWRAKGSRGRPPADTLSPKKLLSLDVRERIFTVLAQYLYLGIHRESLKDDYNDDINEVPIEPLPDLIAQVFPKKWISPKYVAIAQKIKEVGWECGHLVFMDTTDALRDLRDVLVREGIPKERIGLLAASVVNNPVARQAMADAFNGSLKYDANGNPIPGEGEAPELDILLGTTGAMGEGMNLQIRTCVVHHGTLPWEPATIIQRNGRAVRQGNTLKLLDKDFKVEVMFYLAKYTVDAVRLDQILGKRDWQQSLNQRDYDTVTNPAASLERIEVGFALSVRDPLIAAQRLAAIREKNLLKRRARQMKEIARRLDDLDRRARQLRAAPEGSFEARSAETMYTAKAGQLLEYAGDIATNLDEAITRIRRAPTWYSPETGLCISTGESLQVRWRTEVKGRTMLPFRRLKVLHATPGFLSFSYRLMGSLDIAGAGSLEALAGQEKGADLSDLILEPGPWDSARDYEGMTRQLSLQMYARSDTEKRRLIVNTFGLQGLWTLLLDNAGGNDLALGANPPVIYGLPTGEIVLAPLESMSTYLDLTIGYSYRGSQRWNESKGQQTLAFWRTVTFLPGFEALMQAVIEENVYVAVEPPRYGGLAPPGTQSLPAGAGSLMVRRFDPWSADDRKMMALSVGLWLAQFLTQKTFEMLRAEIRGRRKAAGLESAPSTKDPEREEGVDLVFDFEEQL